MAAVHPDLVETAFLGIITTTSAQQCRADTFGGDRQIKILTVVIASSESDIDSDAR